MPARFSPNQLQDMTTLRDKITQDLDSVVLNEDEHAEQVIYAPESDGQLQGPAIVDPIMNVIEDGVVPSMVQIIVSASWLAEPKEGAIMHVRGRICRVGPVHSDGYGAHHLTLSVGEAVP